MDFHCVGVLNAHAKVCCHSAVRTLRALGAPGASSCQFEYGSHQLGASVPDEGRASRAPREGLLEGVDRQGVRAEVGDTAL